MKKKSGLTQRQKMIIEILAQFTADNPVTVQAISEKLKLSSRTILREMNQIDAWFEENDFHLVKK
ncbi:MAG: HTH domain-containing protein, partial [Anaerostipes faecalis]|nr:HTH domain-containing protein [Anaerostipes faecalis]